MYNLYMYNVYMYNLYMYNEMQAAAATTSWCATAPDEFIITIGWLIVNMFMILGIYVEIQWLYMYISYYNEITAVHV